MYLYLSAVAAGLVAGTLFPFLFLLSGAVFAVLCLAWFCQRWRPDLRRFLLLSGGLFVAAAAWSGAWLNKELTHRLPAAQDRLTAELVVQVLAVEQRPGALRLQVQVLSSAAMPEQQSLPALRTLQLNWYRTAETVVAGQQWQIRAVLRSPRNFLNGLSFDYEAFLLSRGIDATGYIRHAELLAVADVPLRQRVLQRQQGLHQAEAWRWIAGLVFGEQGAFTQAHWQLAQQTGTLHLMVVSGLHVGLLALSGLGLWWVIGRSLLLLGSSGVRAVLWPRALLMLLLTGFYVWLAGAGIALQRAWIMLLVLLWLQHSRWRLRWPAALLVALVVVLILNPLIWTRPGFSLSFVAVLALISFFYGRQSTRMEGMWLPQLIVFCALLPVLLWWGQPVSVLQCVANIVAIPYLSLVLLPLALLAALLQQPWLDQWLAEAGEWFWWWLDWSANIPLPYVGYIPLPLLGVWVVWLVLVQRGVSAVVLWPALALLLMWFVRAPVPEPQVVLTDVGQGQSLLFITPAAVLVYDAGPRFSESFDTGYSIVRPVLQRAGVRRIDDLIVSHADLDHAGGLAALLEYFEVGQVWGGEPLKAAPAAQSCHQAGDDWRILSSVLLYRFLLLEDDARLRVRKSGNNLSCVVQLDWYGRRFLLSGDISTDVERELVLRYGAELRSDVLLLGHHGSKTSSSWVFLQTVSPSEAWISAGFNNRFGHPADEVIHRLEQLNIPWRNTARDGAVYMRTNGQTGGLRQHWQPRWRQL